MFRFQISEDLTRNGKWIATENLGVYLKLPEGQQITTYLTKRLANDIFSPPNPLDFRILIAQFSIDLVGD
jgi:hypothetical protein